MNGNTRYAQQELPTEYGRYAHDALSFLLLLHHNGHKRFLYNGYACTYRNDIHSPLPGRRYARKTNHRVQACMYDS